MKTWHQNWKYKLASFIYPELIEITTDLNRHYQYKQWISEARKAFREADKVFSESKDVVARRRARDALYKALRLNSVIFADEITANKIHIDNLTESIPRIIIQE